MSPRATITYILPSIGRPSLARTLASITPWEGDTIDVVQFDVPSGTYGNAERQWGMQRATGNYLAFLDDDNWYVPGHRALQHAAIHEAPDVPTLFRIQYPSGRVLWDRPRVKNGNVDTQMILVPNRPAMLPLWGARRTGGHRSADFHFINELAWPARRINWRRDVIALMGRDDVRFDRATASQTAQER